MELSASVGPIWVSPSFPIMVSRRSGPTGTTAPATAAKAIASATALSTTLGIRLRALRPISAAV